MPDGKKHANIQVKISLGAGLFPAFRPQLQLTEPSCRRTSLWLLPGWFHPKDRGSELTYHGDESRWRQMNDGVMLKAASRGQEFVLNCDDHSEAITWLAELLTLAIHHGAAEDACTW